MTDEDKLKALLMRSYEQGGRDILDSFAEALQKTRKQFPEIEITLDMVLELLKLARDEI